MTKARGETPTKSADLQSSAAQFSELGQQQLGALLSMQQQFFDAAQDMNRAWTARTESEASIVSRLFTKLAAARTLPDAVSAYQECMGQQLDLLTKESRRIYEESGKLMSKSAHLFSNGHTGFGT